MKRATRIVVSVAVWAAALSPGAAIADGRDEAPPEVVETICAFNGDLEELLEEFDQQVGPFEDDTLNEALAKARRNVEKAQLRIDDVRATAAMREMRAAMRHLERGAAVPSSGSGFADDLASLGSFFSERFIAGLIEVADSTGAASATRVANATAYFEAGVAARDNNEWQLALANFKKSAKELERSWVTDATCTD